MSITRWGAIPTAMCLILVACQTASPTDPPESAPPPTPSPTAALTVGPTPTATPEASPTLEPLPGADLVLHNGIVLTVDDDFSVGQAIAISDGKVVAVGSDADMLLMVDAQTRVVDLEGHTVLPGIVDPHVHYIVNVAPDHGGMDYDQDVLLSWGRTTIGIPTIMPDKLEALSEMRDGGRLVLRIHTYLAWNTNCGEPVDISFWDEHTFDRSPDTRLAIAGVKVFMDGGSCRGPAVSFNFDDAPIGLPAGWSGHGDLFTSAAQLADVVRLADSRGAQVVVHAIGDRAIEEALEGYEEGLGGRPNTLGHRIDHNTFIRPELTGRYGEIGLNAVVWGPFNSCIEPDRGWGSFLSDEQRQWLRRHRMLVDENPSSIIAFHSDAPSGAGDLFENLVGLTALAQSDPDDGHYCPGPPWLDGHGVTVQEAVQMMTIQPARVMDIDERVGSLEPGKDADLVILSNDPLSRSGSGLLDNRVLATLIQGRAAWCADDESTDWLAALPGCGPDSPSTPEPVATTTVPPPEPIGSNLAVGAGVRASQALPDEPPAAAVDGAFETWWGSGDGPEQWLEIDLGGLHDIGLIELVVAQYPAGETHHRVLVGERRADLVEAGTLRGATADGDVLRLAVPETAGRRVRYVRVETLESPSWVSWREVRVFGR